MELKEQKENIDFMMITRKYKLSFFGVSPRQDWAVAVILGFILITVFSLIYYFDSEIIKSSISEELLVREEKKPFDVEKVKNLVKDLKIKRGMVDQSQ